LKLIFLKIENKLKIENVMGFDLIDKLMHCIGIALHCIAFIFHSLRERFRKKEMNWKRFFFFFF